MESIIIPIGLGIFIIVLGIFNMKGNISSLHSYHRKRVSEENRIPFGKKVGLGTIIIGVTIILSGLLTFMAEFTKNDLFNTIGETLMITGLIIGFIPILYGMFKYNKGIF